MNKKSTFNEKANRTHNNIPNIEIIDLEYDGNTTAPETETIQEEFPITQESPLQEEGFDAEQTPAKTASSKRKLPSFVNIHLLLFVVLVVFVVAIVGKFRNWGVFVDLSEIESDHSIGYLDVLDQFLPLTDAEGNIVPTGKPKNIVVFGNAPFADDRDSEDNLANLIAKATGANVYNCSVSNSYLASDRYYFNAAKVPMDVYCFYWLVTLGVNGTNAPYFSESAEVLGESTPPEAQEVYDILTSLDFNTVDVVAIMYDASDYLMGHEMYDDTNPTNITQFTGNLEAGIEMLQESYPNIRIIVMSPTYAYAINEDGEYVSSDTYRYGQDVLSTYVIKQSQSSASRGVSFVDNLYGTITEDNAKSYLKDNIHLNTDGRKLVAQRFLDALNRYSGE